MVRAKGVEPSLPREPEPKSGAVILNTLFPSKYAAYFQLTPINLQTSSELPAQKPVQVSVQTAGTQPRLSYCSKLIPNRRWGGFPTSRAQFNNNGFGLGEFLGKRGLVVQAVRPKCAVTNPYPSQINRRVLPNRNQMTDSSPLASVVLGRCILTELRR
jgi:hypothetical protein